MSKVYKIHPAIGVARVGNHPSAFFVGPEKPGAAGLEIGADNSESEVAQFKKDGLLKRQAARFRVYEYETDGNGSGTPVREITAAQAQIDWTVDLVNRKAALSQSLPDDYPALAQRYPLLADHPALARNTHIGDRSTLIIRDPHPQTISGANQRGVEFHGKFLSIPDVYLGELQTDAAGRLVVLGGRGKSESDPAGEDLPTFANNDRWHDDVSDGPVTATLTFTGQTPIVVQQPAWVVVAPPDFAPAIEGIVTLFDWTVQAAIDGGLLRPDARTSFQRHIQPLIQRAANLRWVNSWSHWDSLLPLNWTALADASAASARLRQKVGLLVSKPGFDRFLMPPFLQKYLDDWIGGNFLSDLNAPAPILTEPAALDRAALEACVGSGFYPGIEATSNIAVKELYVEPGRLNRAVAGKVFPGCLTQYMAVPWQADFQECAGGVWWPSQRPDIAFLNQTQIPGSQADWSNPIIDHQAMVDNAQRLGFVVPVMVGADTVFVEAERDVAFPRQ
jgi:hypothetical protein